MTREQGRALYLWIDDNDLPPEVVEHLKHGDEPERSLFLLAYWWRSAHPNEEPTIGKDLMDALLEEDVEHQYHRHADREDAVRANWPL